MRLTIAVRTWALTRVVLAVLLGSIAEQAMAQTTPSKAAGNKPLEGTYWKATELAGKPTPVQDAKRQAHLLFQTGGRVSGSDGCNWITGSYTLKGNVVTFGEVVGTMMACIDIGDIDRAFRDAEACNPIDDRRRPYGAGRYDGKPVAVFTAQAQTPASPLQGTSWQLVRFQGGDDKVLTPTTARNTRSSSTRRSADRPCRL
jgi:heat shock protein HslJ